MHPSEGLSPEELLHDHVLCQNQRRRELTTRRKSGNEGNINVMVGIIDTTVKDFITESRLGRKFSFSEKDLEDLQTG